VKTSRAAPSRARYHHGDLRNALLRAALQLIARQGVESFSLREAARAVGVSPAAAYRHFEDKAALLAALALDGLGRMALAMNEAIARAPGAPGTPARAAADLAAIGAAYVEFAVANPAQFRVMFGPWCDHPEIDELPAEAFPGGRDPYQILVDVLDALVRTGAVAAETRAGAEVAAWSAVHGLASLLVERSLPLDAAERRAAVAQVVRTILAGLGAPALAPAPPPGPNADPRAARQRRRADRAG
jgi:AcrR family transcriptional regulator